MASAEPLLPGEQQDARLKKNEPSCAKKCCCYLFVGALVVFAILALAQAFIYSVITFGCGPKAIGDNYVYPGGGKSQWGGAAYNLVPRNSIISERHHGLWGQPFDVMPANEAGTAAGAQVGTWWRNNGIFFYTYTYEDIANSKVTLYMRSNMMPFTSYKIARCDGQGPVVTFSEYGNWINNKIRHFLRMNQAQTYSIWFDNQQVAHAQEVTSGFPSLTITNTSLGSKEIASSILTNRHFHGNKDQWYVVNKVRETMPFYVTQAISVPFAFENTDRKKSDAAAATQKKPSFLAENLPGQDVKETRLQPPDTPAALAAKGSPAGPGPETPVQAAEKAYSLALRNAKSGMAEFERRVDHLKSLAKDKTQLEELFNSMLKATGPDVGSVKEAEAKRKAEMKELKRSNKAAFKAAIPVARSLEWARKAAGVHEGVYEPAYQDSEAYLESMEDHAEDLADRGSDAIESIYQNIQARFERARDEEKDEATQEEKENVRKEKHEAKKKKEAQEKEHTKEIAEENAQEETRKEEEANDTVNKEREEKARDSVNKETEQKATGSIFHWPFLEEKSKSVAYTEPVQHV